MLAVFVGTVSVYVKVPSESESVKLHIPFCVAPSTNVVSFRKLPVSLLTMKSIGTIMPEPGSREDVTVNDAELPSLTGEASSISIKIESSIVTEAEPRVSSA